MNDFFKKLSSILTRTELWVIVATILYTIKEADLFSPETGIYKAIALGSAILGALGYGVIRTVRKSARDKANSIVEVARLEADPSRLSPPTSVEPPIDPASSQR